MQVEDMISKDEIPPSTKRIKLDAEARVASAAILRDETTSANANANLAEALARRPTSLKSDDLPSSNKSIDVSEDEAALAMLSMFGAAPPSSDVASEAAAVSLSTALFPAVTMSSPPPPPLAAPPKKPTHTSVPPKTPKTKKPKKKRARENTDDSKADANDDSDDQDKLYCICRKPYEQGVFMIACDKCDDWFHGDCVNISSKDAKRISTYICAQCEKRLREEEARKEQLRLEEARRQLLLQQQQALQSQKTRVPKTDRPCLFGKCGDFARENSNYCSHECGVRFALIQVEREKMEEAARRKREDEAVRKAKFALVLSSLERRRESGHPLSILEQQDLFILQEIQKEIQKINEKRVALVEQRRWLQTAIERARSLPLQEVNPNTTSSSSVMETKKGTQRQATLDVVDCVSCGQPIHHTKLSRHLESCYLKVENTHSVVAKELIIDEDGTNIVCCDSYDPRSKTYCKKLKASCPLHSEHFSSKHKKTTSQADRCGCPTSEFPSGICELARDDCDKHSNWESLRAGELVLEEISLNQALNAFLFDERVVTDRLIQRQELPLASSESALHGLPTSSALHSAVPAGR